MQVESYTFEHEECPVTSGEEETKLLVLGTRVVVPLKYNLLHYIGRMCLDHIPTLRLASMAFFFCLRSPCWRHQCLSACLSVYISSCLCEPLLRFESHFHAGRSIAHSCTRHRDKIARESFQVRMKYPFFLSHPPLAGMCGWEGVEAAIEACK